AGVQVPVVGGVTAVVGMTVHPPGPGGPSARSALCPCLEQPPRDSTKSAEIFWAPARGAGRCRAPAVASRLGLGWRGLLVRYRGATWRYPFQRGFSAASAHTGTIMATPQNRE